jgi:hypothetical protein
MHHSPSLHLISQNDSLEKRNELAKKKKKKRSYRLLQYEFFVCLRQETKIGKREKKPRVKANAVVPIQENFFCGGRLMHL